MCVCTRNSRRVQCMNKQSRISFLMDGVMQCYPGVMHAKANS